MIFGQKPCFLGPRQLARQKVNIHYYVYVSVSDVCLAGVNEMDSGLFKFFGGIMDFGDKSPEYCWIECQRQGLAAEDSKIPFIGIANATLCFCGIDYENKVEGK